MDSVLIRCNNAYRYGPLHKEPSQMARPWPLAISENALHVSCRIKEGSSPICEAAVLDGLHNEGSKEWPQKIDRALNCLTSRQRLHLNPVVVQKQINYVK